MTHILPVGCGGPDSFQAYCFGTQQLPGNKHKTTLPSNMCPYVLISNFWWLTQRVNLTPEVGSRAAIFKMTVDLIQIWWPGGTSFIFCDLNMNVESWLSLELCPLVWWSGILPSLVHFYQTCLGSSWVLLWEVRPCKSRRGPPQGRACELCWWKGPLRPSACHLVAFFGGYLLSGLGTPAALVLSLQQSPQLTTAFGLFHWQLFLSLTVCTGCFSQCKQPPSHPPTCLDTVCLALPTREGLPFRGSICQLPSGKPRCQLSLKDLFPFAQTGESMGSTELEGVWVALNRRCQWTLGSWQTQETIT